MLDVLVAKIYVLLVFGPEVSQHLEKVILNLRVEIFDRVSNEFKRNHHSEAQLSEIVRCKSVVHQSFENTRENSDF